MMQLTPFSRMKFCFLGGFCAAVLFVVPLRAQTFNYSVLVNSTSWQELTSQTLCNTVNVTWASSYRLPIGFSFPFNGTSCDSVTVETNGYLVFDENRDQAFTAYSMFRDKLDASGNHSVLSYQLTGTVGNRIFKLQYKNVGLSDYPMELLSYQIWLHESGRIELITGNNSYQPDPNDSLAVADTSQYVRTGLLNMNMTGTVRGYFAGTTSSGPGGQPLNDAFPEPVFFNVIPAAGTRFVFLPIN
jgi:hypothetical protein